MQEKPAAASGAKRAPRADARRNRERVLAAAQAAFAAEGISVPLDEIARRAGVGPGTVYRHFPTKEALFHAAITDNVERMIDYARGLTTAADPGAAFFELLDRMVTEGGVKRDLAEALGGHEAAGTSVPTKELVTEIDVLLRRAQQSGAVRADIGTDDLMRILKGAFLAAHTTGADEQQRSRAFAVVFDGLRAR
ncbi:TetR/AcrR family transcriptional regulator [Nocardia wallacei]|uniref:TetR/AcrR family transcriptional regulator n=1 Tax=Nocardia wallacei TaxID=480035 RepID=UPI002454A1F9|nr:helix-turn-helix domain-containing protein [Nocardia wallacei]